MITKKQIDRIAEYISAFYYAQYSVAYVNDKQLIKAIQKLVREKDIITCAVDPFDGEVLFLDPLDRTYSLEFHIGGSPKEQLILNKNPTASVGSLINKYLLNDPDLPDLSTNPKSEPKTSNKPEILDYVARHVRCYMEREISTRASLKRYYNQHPAAPDIGSLTEEAVSSIEVAVDSIVNKAADILSCMSDVSFINGCLLGNIASGYACNRLLGHVPALKYTSTRDPIFYTDRVNEMCESYIRSRMTMLEGYENGRSRY